MKISRSKSLSSICSFFILLLCVPYVVSSYHAAASPHKPLKFNMKPWYRQVESVAGGRSDKLRADAFPTEQSIAMLVNISFGKPPIPQFLLMDTGSDITWIQCASCTKCFNSTAPVYDSSKSETYQDLDCGSSFCQSPQTCDGVRQICLYDIGYQDYSRSSGVLGTDQLTLTLPDHETITVPGVVFGCGVVNRVNPHYDHGSGSLGLSAGPLSLSSQKGGQFSYCIGNLTNHNYPHNQLIIGDGAIFRGITTPMEVYNDKYYVNLQRIRVNKKLLSIDPEIFRKSPYGDGGVIIDSGTTDCYLPKAAWEVLKEEVGSILRRFLKRSHQLDNSLCFQGTLSKPNGYPKVTLYFEGDAQLFLPPNSLFIQVNWFTVCMAVNPVMDSRDHAIIGLLAQQNYNVGYDLANKKLHIEKVPCEIL